MKILDGQAFPDGAEDSMVEYLTGPVEILVADADLIYRMHQDIWALVCLLHFSAPPQDELSPNLRYWQMMMQQYDFDALDVKTMVRDVVRGVIAEWTAKGQLK